MTSLNVAPCPYEAARFAVTRWHYSKAMPAGKLVRYGAWEDDEFVGAVIYSRGASPWLGYALDLDHTEVCELTRVALRRHQSPVSAIVARTLRLLRRDNPGLRAVVSFADPNEGHHGGIYQAGNWIYTGQSGETIVFRVNGRWQHMRGAYWKTKGRNVPTRTLPGKHRYVMPLDKPMRRHLRQFAQPYPTRTPEPA